MKRRLFDIGKMRHRISLYEITRTDDGAGGFERSDPSNPTKIGAFWGRIEPLTVRERTWSEQFTQVTTHSCWLRYNAQVQQGMIVRKGSIDYYVETVIDPNQLKEFMLLGLREGGPL
jgi:SPP1 family predicted phage head-tail adaptor